VRRNGESMPIPVIGGGPQRRVAPTALGGASSRGSTMEVLMKRAAVLGISTLGIILIILLVLLLLGAFPTFGFHGYGYAPSGLLLVVLIVIVVLVATNRL
jgi:hypothetical protein